MSSQSPTVSVLIVSYNVKQYLLHAIDTVIASNYDGEIEVIVTDNNSYDGSVEALAKTYPKVKTIPNQENVGFGKAVNQAAKIASGDYLLILNPDTIMEESTISTFVDYMESKTHVGMIGPKILNADGSLQPACKRSFPRPMVALPKLLGLSKLFPNSKWAGKYNLTYLDPDVIHSVDAISGSCMFVRKNIFDQIGGFDEQFFMFGEDIDLCYQIKNNDFEIHYVPTAKIIHFHGESVKSAPYDSLHAFYSAMILFSEKHFSSSQMRFTRLFINSGVRVRKLIAFIGSIKSQIVSVSLDAISVLIAFSIAIPLRFIDFEPVIRTKGFIPVIYVIFWLLIGSLFQLYSRYILSYTRAIMSSIAGFFLAAAFTYIFKQFAFSRLVIIVAAMLITLIIPGWRMLFHYLMSHGLFKPVKDKNNILFSRKTLIIGTDKEAIRIARHLSKRFDSGLELVGFCDNELTIPIEELPIPFVGRLSDLRGIIKKYNIREIIFPTAQYASKNVLSIMDETKDLRLTYRMVPRNQDILLGKASIEDIGDYSFVNIEYTLFHRLNWFIKRFFDIIIAVSLSIIFSPISLFKLSGRQSKSFWGVDNTTFKGTIYKSRYIFIQNLPLLKKIIEGKMSFVGSSLITANEDNPNLICVPGLTGMQRLRNVNFTAEDQRVLDHYYIQNQSFTLDLEIIMKTVFTG
ncbi:MAG: glycosyltransferase [Candidatus Marinimicrobia bacterium]|nr:glycosyltransferase [Candidatus Neomarinimicrobiota bacterium]